MLFQMRLGCGKNIGVCFKAKCVQVTLSGVVVWGVDFFGVKLTKKFPPTNLNHQFRVICKAPWAAKGNTSLNTGNPNGTGKPPFCTKETDTLRKLHTRVEFALAVRNAHNDGAFGLTAAL